MAEGRVGDRADLSLGLERRPEEEHGGIKPEHAGSSNAQAGLTASNKFISTDWGKTGLEGYAGPVLKSHPCIQPRAED